MKNKFFLRIIRKLKLTLSGDIEDNFGYIPDVQELLANENFLETKSQSNTVKFCLKNLRAKYVSKNN